MDRRTFLAGTGAVLLAAPLAAEAQAPPRIWRIGTLDAADSRGWAGFREGLRDLGWANGQKVVMEPRWTSGQAERYRELAEELVRSSVDVLVTGNWESTRAAKQATSIIPIVMLGVSDPPAAGLVGNFQRPGGNVTGVVYQPADLADKSIQLLQEILLGTPRVALLYNPHVWASSVNRQRLTVVAARRGLDILPLAVKERADLETAFGALTLERPDVLIVDATAALWGDPARISQFAIQHRLTTMSSERDLADAGLLVAYGPALYTIGRAAASYVSQILNGAHPADLPVEQPTKFELVINLKTAKALGLTIPQSVLQRADEVIQ